MSSGTDNVRSDYYASYSFTAPGDGMMLGSVICNTASNSETLILRNNSSNVSGSNVRYPDAGVATTHSGTQFTGNSYRYGVFPSFNNGFRRNETITVETDIFNYSEPGVYLLRLSGDNAVESRPIFSSTAFTGLFAPGVNLYNAVIVYPGWGFRLFNAMPNSATWNATFPTVIWDDISYIYFNDTNEPLFFTCAADRGSNSKNFGRSNEATPPSRGLPNLSVTIPIMTQVRNNTAATGNSTNRSFPDYAEDGIQIFYRLGAPFFRFGLAS